MTPPTTTVPAPATSTPPRCPTGGTAEQIRMGLVGCGSTNVEEDPAEPGVYDCLDCGIWFTPAREPSPA